VSGVFPGANEEGESAEILFKKIIKSERGERGKARDPKIVLLALESRASRIESSVFMSKHRSSFLLFFLSLSLVRFSSSSTRVVATHRKFIKRGTQTDRKKKKRKKKAKRYECAQDL
jgi:hypothetical protein